jgi:hypothetical protein
LTLAVGQYFTLLRPDYLLAPISRAFLPYLTAVLLLVATCALEMHTIQYTGENPTFRDPHLSTIAATKELSVNLLVQSPSTPWFHRPLYRHYGGSHNVDPNRAGSTLREVTCHMPVNGG